MGAIDCQDALCTSGTRRVLVDGPTERSGPGSVAVPPLGHPLEGMPVVAYTSKVGTNEFALKMIICDDGDCTSCNVTTKNAHVWTTVTVRSDLADLFACTFVCTVRFGLVLCFFVLVHYCGVLCGRSGSASPLIAR